MLWVDPTSPAIRSAVVSGVYGKEPHSEHGYPVIEEIDPITEALTIASDILTQLTAFRVHPAGIAVEDFQASPRAHRLSPNYTPIRRVTGIDMVLEDELTPILDGWKLANDNIRFENRCGVGFPNSWWSNSVMPYYGNEYGNGYGYRDNDPGLVRSVRIRVTYQFGSTITASARRAVLWFAHQLWLETNGCQDCGECQLPERTTSVQREGISYTLLNPQDYLRDGKTGLPSVDLYLASVNPRRASRPSAVFTPDSPPPENVSIQTVRPVWAPA
jgi:hypothetical protein